MLDEISLLIANNVRLSREKGEKMYRTIGVVFASNKNKFSFFLHNTRLISRTLLENRVTIHQ